MAAWFSCLTAKLMPVGFLLQEFSRFEVNGCLANGSGRGGDQQQTSSAGQKRGYNWPKTGLDRADNPGKLKA
jgi:hypothetical protein